MALNDKSTARLDQYSELELLFVNNAAAVAMKAAFGARRALYGSSMADCYGYRDAANGTTEGFTKAKNKAKRVSSVSASALTGKGNSYAISIADTTLGGQMTAWTENFLYTTNDPDYAGAVQGVFDALNPFITSDPTGSAPYFTTPELTDMQNDKDDYTGKLNKYKAALSTINTAKGNFVTLQVPIMEEHITFMEGFLTDINKTYPDFVTAFKAIVQKLSVIGKRNQGVSATMNYASDGKAIALVGELRITNYPAIKHPKVIHTNSMGVIALLQLKIGVWDGVFSAPNCDDQPVTITVETKKVVHFAIKMKETKAVEPPAV